jgi:hypothetical protein
VSVPAGLDATVSVSVLVVEQRVTKIDALSYMRPVALGIIDNMPLDVVGGMMIRLYAEQVRNELIDRATRLLGCTLSYVLTVVSIETWNC